MAITVSSILSFVNNALSRAETDVTAEVQAVVDQLEDRMLFEAADLGDTIDNEDYYSAAPSDFNGLLAILVNDGTYDGLPLIPISWEEYRNYMADFTSTDRSKPEFYAEFLKRFYFWPPPGGDYTVKLWYYKELGTISTEVDAADQFKNVLNFGTTYEVAYKYGLEKYIALWEKKFARELALRESMKTPTAAIVK